MKLHATILIRFCSIQSYHHLKDVKTLLFVSIPLSIKEFSQVYWKINSWQYHFHFLFFHYKHVLSSHRYMFIFVGSVRTFLHLTTSLIVYCWTWGTAGVLPPIRWGAFFTYFNLGVAQPGWLIKTYYIWSLYFILFSNDQNKIVRLHSIYNIYMVSFSNANFFFFICFNNLFQWEKPIGEFAK